MWLYDANHFCPFSHCHSVSRFVFATNGPSQRNPHLFASLKKSASIFLAFREQLGHPLPLWMVLYVACQECLCRHDQVVAVRVLTRSGPCHVKPHRTAISWKSAFVFGSS